MATKKDKWQVAQRVSGWYQQGKTGAEQKCAAHFIPLKGATTACGKLPVRGDTRGTGSAHYGLHWFPALDAPRTTCQSCKARAPQIKADATEQVA